MGEQLGMPQRKYFGIALKYGLSGAALTLVGFTIAYFIFDNAVQSFRQLSFIMVIVFMFFAVKEYRATQSERLLFWQGAALSALTFLIFGLFTALALGIFLEYIDPESFSYYINYKLESLERYRELMEADEFTRYSEMTKNQTPQGIAIEHLFGLIYVGVFGSLFIAAILRRAPGYQPKNQKSIFI